MKILYSLPHPADRLNNIKGAGHLVRATSLLNALQNLGHDILRMEAAAETGSSAPVRAYRNIVKRAIPRPIAMIMRDWGRIQYSRNYAIRLIHAVTQFKPDIILETHIAFSLAGKIASQQTGVPLVLDDCAPAWEEEQQYGVGLKTQALRIHREVTSHASLVIAVNETLSKLLIEGGIPPSKVVTIPNGVDQSFFDPGIDAQGRRNQLGFLPNEIVIVFVGSFQPYHRVDLLLQALQQMKSRASLRLLLVGFGRTYNETLKLARDLGLTERVIFTGSVLYSEVPSYIAAADIAIMPATNLYGNPMKVYEYMALGKPVLAPRQPTIQQIISEGEDGLLFEPDNISEISGALTGLVENSSLRERLGAAAKLRGSAQTWQNRAGILDAALQKILGERHF